MAPLKRQAQLPLLALIHTAANCGRLIQRAKKYGVFEKWIQRAEDYCLARYFGIYMRADEVARLAQLIGLSNCTKRQVQDSCFEMAVRIDNLLCSHGFSDQEEDDEEETSAHE